MHTQSFFQFAFSNFIHKVLVSPGLYKHKILAQSPNSGTLKSRLHGWETSFIYTHTYLYTNWFTVPMFLPQLLSCNNSWLTLTAMISLLWLQWLWTQPFPPTRQTRGKEIKKSTKQATFCIKDWLLENILGMDNRMQTIYLIDLKKNSVLNFKNATAYNRYLKKAGRSTYTHTHVHIHMHTCTYTYM